MEQRDYTTKPRKWKQLTEKDRYKIEAWLEEGVSAGEIASRLGYSRRTIERERKMGMVIQRRQNPSNNKDAPEYIDEMVYKADRAQDEHDSRAEMKGRGLKIGKDQKLADYIEDKIKNDKWSPDAVAGRICEENLQFDTRVCTKTIYNYIDQGVFRELTNKDLLIKKDGHKRGYSKVRSVPLNNRKGKSIEERPTAVADRAEPGHWELDLVVGKHGTPEVIMTLVERVTRMSVYVLSPDKTQASIIAALRKASARIRADFNDVIKTITTDNGSEFLDGAGLKEASGCSEVYYCHPYCSYEKGSNENGNKVLRRFVPKGTDIGTLTESALQRIEDWVNNYPRRILGYKTAREMMNI